MRDRLGVKGERERRGERGEERDILEERNKRREGERE